MLPWRGAMIMDSWRADSSEDPSLARRINKYNHRPAEELYDLRTDPFEMTNLASDPSFSQIRARLEIALNKWMKQQGDHGIETELNALSRKP